MTELLQQFQHNWQQHAFNPGNKIILLAVSGGADSMVLAHLFLNSGIPFCVAHCNFQLRAEASDLDEQLVKDWCQQHQITVHTTRFDTQKLATEWKKGIQETARILRYQWFEELSAANKYYKVATAHHANDNVETLLMNLFRGTGIAGLHGIQPDQGNVIRPLLFAQKSELLAWATENHVTYRDDASNDSDDYLRNALRRNIVPVINEWFPDAAIRVNETIVRLAEAEQLYNENIDEKRKKLLEQRGKDVYVPIKKLIQFSPLATICYELFKPFGFTSLQGTHILHLLKSESGHFVLSPTHRIIKNRDFLIVTQLPSQATDLIVIDELPLIVATAKYTYTFTIEDRPEKLDTSMLVAQIPADLIRLPLFLRKWKTGDYFYPLGMDMKKKKVSRVLINEKVPLHEKEHIFVLEQDKKILWLTSLRLDERFKVKNNTQKVLIVRMTPL